MRTALVHGSSGVVGNQVWKSLARIWPQAELFSFSTAKREAAAAHPLNARGHDLAVTGSWTLDQTQHHAVLELRDFDLVISADPQAAGQIRVSSTALHVCYLPPVAEGHAAPFCPGAIPVRTRSLGQYQGRMLSLLAGSRQYQEIHKHAELAVPAGVTHFVAVSRAMSEQFRLSCHKTCAIIYPPVDNAFFRPGPEPREAFYLMVGHGPLTPELELGVAACESAHRSLQIVGLDAAGRSSLKFHTNVHCVESVSDEILRDGYRRCRAILVPGISEFDPALLEAQACGAPVVALYGGGALETLLDCESTGQGTGLFFHEPTVGSLVSAIRELERRPHKFSPDLGWAQAARFSRARFEREFRAYVQEICAVWQSSGTAAGAALEQGARTRAA